MNKLFCFILISLILTGLAPPLWAHFGASVRGDVGMLGNQLPYFILQTGTAPTTKVETIDYLSCPKGGRWDFTARLFVYTSSDPCPTYIAASWQGSSHTITSCEEAIKDLDEGLSILLPLRTFTRGNTFGTDELIFFNDGSPACSKIAVKNKFSKAKLGVGFDLIKNKCCLFTMEVGANYLNAQLDTGQNIIITQTKAQGPGCIFVPPGTHLCSPPADELPFDFVVHNDTWQKTEGAGIYANIKTEYKLPATCLRNCFSIYAKAEVADIIGRQKYNNRVCCVAEFDLNFDPLIPPQVFDYDEHLCERYNNIVEVDLEAAFVYSPCFSSWDDLRPHFAVGVRTDSFVNLFSKPAKFRDISYLSLTRSTIFFELSLTV